MSYHVLFNKVGIFHPSQLSSYCVFLPSWSNMLGQSDLCRLISQKKLILFLLLVLHISTFSEGVRDGVSSKPKIVNIGALFTFNSTIGRAAKIAIEAAVDDVNSNSSILSDTKLLVKMQNTECNGFFGLMEVLQFMETDIVAIVGPQSSTLAHAILHVVTELQVPLLSFAATDPTLSPLQHPFFIRTTQSDLFQMAAVADIVDYYQWRQVIAIYVDDDHGRNGVSALGDKLSDKRCKITCKCALPPGSSRNEITDLLVKVALMESRVIVLHANPDSGLMVLSVAHHLGMVRDGYVWIATDWLTCLLDTSAPLAPEAINAMQGVLGLRQHMVDSARRKALTSRLSKLKNDANDIHIGINSYALYAYDTVWIIAQALDAFFNDGGTISFSNDSRLHDVDDGRLHLEAMTVFDDGKLFMDEILKTDIMGVTGRILFDSKGQIVDPAYDIINVIGTGFRTIGYWSNHSGLSVLSPETLYSKPPNKSVTSQKLYSVIWPGETSRKPRGWVFPSNGKRLKIGVPYRATYREFITKVKGSDIVKGYCIDVFAASVNLLPYAVPYRFVPFGNGLQNPSYNELVNKVALGEFDAAIGDIAIVTNRTKIVDFTQPYIESGLVILAAAKKRSSSGWAFLQPFTVKMWCVTGVSFLIVGAIVWILEHRHNDEFRGPPKQQVATIFWFTFSTLFFSHRENTVSTLGRFVLVIWLFVVLIIQSSYTASLTSILTVQQLSSPVKGIDGLIRSNEPIGFQVGSFAENYMVDELGITRSRLKTLYTPEDYAKALELGPRNGGVAAIVDERPYVDLFLSRQCKFTVIGSEFTKSGWGFAFPRDSPLAVDMSTAILTLSENGDLQRIHDKWLTRAACSSKNTELDADRLHLRSFLGLFLICGIACFLALIMYLVLTVREYCQHSDQGRVDSSDPGSSRSSTRHFRRFLSFADEKLETREMRKQRQLGGRLASSNSSNLELVSAPQVLRQNLDVYNHPSHE